MVDTHLESMSKPQPILYSKNGIHLATVLGGPVATGYLLRHNFQAFNDANKAKLSIRIGALCTAIIVVLILTLPSSVMERLPKQLIPFLYVGAEYLIVRKYQATQIDEHLTAGGHKYSLWRSAGIGTIGMILTVIPIFLFIHDDTPKPGGKVMTFGKIQNEIYFDLTSLSSNQVDSLGKQLTSVDFFNEDQQNYVSLTRRKDLYEIAFPVIKDAWSNPDAVSYFKALHDTLQSLNPEKRILINLVYPDISTIRLTIGNSISQPNSK